MTASSAPKPESDGAPPSDAIERLGQRAAELAAAAGHHAVLLLDEGRYHVAQALRQAVLSLVISATAIIAAAVGYGMLVRELASWLADLCSEHHPQPVRILVCAGAAALPLVLLALRAKWQGHRDLQAVERRQRRPAP
jgi:hypothetical protein